jgi:ribA/ribD-fused uncharacterized protein
LSTAGHAKRAGRKLKLRKDWDEIKLTVMEEVLKMKFLGNQKLAQKLIDTGDAVLIEGNWWNDTYWGVCNDKGENHLGQLLMKIRKELQ